VKEIFELILLEIKRSGYDGLLPAGMVLTGGTSACRHSQLASQVLGVPSDSRAGETGGPGGSFEKPAYSTGFGLLHWAAALSEEDLLPGRTGGRHTSKKENPMDLVPLRTGSSGYSRNKQIG